MYTSLERTAEQQKQYPKGCEEAYFGADTVVVGNVADELTGRMCAVIDLRAPLHPLELEASAKLVLERQLLPTLR